MIVRTWSGATRVEDADRYESVLRETGLPAYRATPGHRGAWVLRRREGPHEEFLVVSLWDSMRAVQAFAGPHPQRAVFYPEDEEYLVRADRVARHWRVGTGGGLALARRADPSRGYPFARGRPLGHGDFLASGA